MTLSRGVLDAWRSTTPNRYCDTQYALAGTVPCNESRNSGMRLKLAPDNYPQSESLAQADYENRKSLSHFTYRVMPILRISPITPNGLTLNYT